MIVIRRDRFAFGPGSGIHLKPFEMLRQCYVISIRENCNRNTFPELAIDRDQ